MGEGEGEGYEPSLVTRPGYSFIRQAELASSDREQSDPYKQPDLVTRLIRTLIFWVSTLCFLDVAAVHCSPSQD